MTSWAGRFKTGWMSANANLPVKGTPKGHEAGSSGETGALKVGLTMLLCIVLGIIGMAIALQSNGTIARGLLWAGAWSSIGWFLGFLFGIPRFLSTDTARTPESPSVEAAKQQAVAASFSAKAARDAANAAKDAKDRADQAAATLVTAAVAADAASADAVTALQGDPNNAALQADVKSKGMSAADAKRVSDEARAEADKAAIEWQSKATAASLADAALETAKANADAVSAKATTSRGPSVTVNTNLEQISDWLTKIIVGVSLVESQALLMKMHGAATFMARSMLKAGDAMPQPLETVAAFVPISADAGGSAAAAASAAGAAASAAGVHVSTAVALAAPSLAAFYSLESVAYAVMLYFLATGLLGSYLLTRLYLQRVLQEAAGD